MATYIGQCHTIEGTPIHSITRHMIDLFSGERGARFWRQKLGAEATRAASPLSFMEDVLIQMDKKISSETVPPEGI
jgi:tRNA-dihydrouridine synthase A